jgi:hypothetical protein
MNETGSFKVIIAMMSAATVYTLAAIFACPALNTVLPLYLLSQSLQRQPCRDSKRIAEKRKYLCQIFWREEVIVDRAEMCVYSISREGCPLTQVWVVALL